jgi:hypothetical protein
VLLSLSPLETIVEATLDKAYLDKLASAPSHLQQQALVEGGYDAHSSWSVGSCAAPIATTTFSLTSISKVFGPKHSHIECS